MKRTFAQKAKISQCVKIFDLGQLAWVTEYLSSTFLIKCEDGFTRFLFYKDEGISWIPVYNNNKENNNNETS